MGARVRCGWIIVDVDELEGSHDSVGLKFPYVAILMPVKECIYILFRYQNSSVETLLDMDRKC